MNNISFQSRIKIMDMNSFYKEISIPKKNFVNYPWTVKESVLANKVGTTEIFDCTAAGFTDGLNALLLHICPTNSKNKNLQKIATFIEDKINLHDPNLEGFILGSKNKNYNSPQSPAVFDFFEKLMQKHNIPYSKFRGGDFEHNVAYSATKDEWIIGSSLLNNIDWKDTFKTPEKACSRIFDEFKLSDCDSLDW